MARTIDKAALALIAGGVLAAAGGFGAVDRAQAGEPVRRPGIMRPAAHPRLIRAAEARPLTIRRRARVGAVDVVGGPGFYGDDYLVRQHSWNDPRLYYWGPFRTGGDSFYGDVAGSPITRGNAALGQIAGYGPARGGYGGPHFDAVGGFHNGPGPDYKIDGDYASGSLSRPDYGDIVPRYPSVAQRVATLNTGVVPRSDDIVDRGAGKATSRASFVAFEQAKAEFASPMRREAPVEAGFDNGGLSTMGMQVGNGEF